MCDDINECNGNPCYYNQVCQNTQGSYNCLCKSGYYSVNNTTCADINECLQNPCTSNQTCTNTDGSYLCPCKVYYTPFNNTCLFQGRSI